MIEITTVIALKSFPRKLGHFYDNFSSLKSQITPGSSVRIIGVVLYC